MAELNKVDFTKLKDDLAKQKKEQHTKQIAMGSEGGVVKGGKKAFLNELVHSMRTGQKSEAIGVIQAVNETVEYTKGVPQAVAKNRRSHMPPRQRQQVMNEEHVPQQVRTGASDWGMQGGQVNLGGGRGNYGDEREMQFEQALQSSNAAFDQMMMGRNPASQNPQYQQLVQQHPQYAQQQPQQQYIVEQPQHDQMNLINEKIEKNLEKMVESSFKNVLTDIYTKQKIHEALADFLKSEDFIKVVGQAINEIAKKNKAKQVK